jgi:two-component system response regulator NreC
MSDYETEPNTPTFPSVPMLESPKPWEPLSKRESEVARMLAVGKTNSEIAEHLFIAVKTVDTHRGHIMQKLGTRNNVELARLALRLKQVTL